MELKITVTYKVDGGIDEELDEKIVNEYKDRGHKWLGQGLDLISGVRDISFTRDSHALSTPEVPLNA